MSIKREIKWFFITDYEEESAYLRQMHKDGWKLVKLRMPCFYFFESCEPADVIYELDFKPGNHKDVEEYYQLFRDYGWEHIQDCNGFSYFRRENSGEERPEIFSDNQSKLELAKRIFYSRMIPLGIIFIAIILPIISKLYRVSGFVYGLYVFLFLMYLAIFIHCGKGFIRLNKKYSGKGE